MISADKYSFHYTNLYYKEQCLSVTLKCSAKFFIPFLTSDFKSNDIFEFLGKAG